MSKNKSSENEESVEMDTNASAAVRLNTEFAQFRVIRLFNEKTAEITYMMVLLNHHDNLQNELVNGLPFAKKDGYDAVLPVQFFRMTYSDVYRELNATSKRMNRSRSLAKFSLTVILAFQPSVTDTSFMVCRVSSLEEVRSTIAALKDLYGSYVYPDDHVNYPGTSATLKPKIRRVNKYERCILDVIYGFFSKR